MIGLLSGSVSAAARSLGHYVSLALTSVLLAVVGAMLARSASSGPRARIKPHSRRWGPFILLCVSAPLILADIMRHVLQDVGVWPGCGNNPTFSRANSSDPFPASCLWSSSQYRCEIVCCVPTWLPVPNATASHQAEYAWYPPQTSLWPDSVRNGTGGGTRSAAASRFQFGTLRQNGSLYLPAQFVRDIAREPYVAFSAPVAFFADGTRLERARWPAECAHGTNSDTGACLLVDATLPYAEQLAALPLRDASAPFDARSNPRECSCDGCTAHEDMAHLSPMGWALTVVATYSGFALLAASVLWNANIGAQLRKIGAEWRALRARATTGRAGSLA